MRKVRVRYERGALEGDGIIDAGPPPVKVFYDHGELRLVGPTIDYSLWDVKVFTIEEVEATP